MQFNCLIQMIIIIILSSVGISLSFIYLKQKKKILTIKTYNVSLFTFFYLLRKKTFVSEFYKQNFKRGIWDKNLLVLVIKKI